MPATPTPVVAGTNWYADFDEPVWDERGRFWIVGRDHTSLGRVRGGHAYTFKPQHLTDAAGWWRFHDQGHEGSCVGWAIARCLSLLNRRDRYDALDIYHRAQRDYDEWAGEAYSGTSIRAGLDVVRIEGPHRVRGDKRVSIAPDPAHGIAENRWATDVSQMIEAMRSPRYLTMGRAPFCNSWGTDWPRLVWMPLDTIDRLIREDGELAIITDRKETT